MKFLYLAYKFYVSVVTYYQAIALYLLKEAIKNIMGGLLHLTKKGSYLNQYFTVPHTVYIRFLSTKIRIEMKNSTKPFGFRTVCFHSAPSGKNLYTAHAFGGRNVLIYHTEHHQAITCFQIVFLDSE